MRNAIWIVVFLVVLFAQLAAIYLENETLRFFTKPLLLPILGIYFITGTKNISSNLKTWVVLALFFSWVGDIKLMFETKNANFFLFGLSAFFMAQLFYIIYFNNIRMREWIRGNVLFLLIIVIYYSALVNILSPYLREMSLPVRIYGVL